ncbi:hypothetical protein GGI43DRAFT_426042 [Trichoderma evansii]
MESTNYRQLHPGRPYHPEPLQGPPAPSWMPREHDHPQGPQAYSLQNHAPRPLAYHSPGRAGTNLDSYQMSFGGGLLLPNPTPQAYTLPHPHGGYLPRQGHWASLSMQAPIPPNHAGMMNMSGGLRYEPPPILPAVGSGYLPQPPESEPGIGLHDTMGLEADTQPQGRYAQQPAMMPMPYVVAPPPPLQAMPNPQPVAPAPQSRRYGYPSSPASSRVSRAPISSLPSYTAPPLYHELSGLSGLSPHRRSAHSRARRSSLNTRLTASDLSRDTEEEGVHNSNDHRPDPMNYRTGQEPAAAVENTPARPIQTSRGAEKNVPTKIALRLLQSVKIEDLPEKDRTCVICYNDFGVETPEGIKESPLRLPKCKHVFGDKCIKRWFEESDSCPYCRDKLATHLYSGFDANRTNAFLTMMRARAQLPPGSSEEMYMRFMSSAMQDEEEVGETQDVIMLESPASRSGGDSDSSSALDNENIVLTSSGSSSASASPARVPPRDVSRFTQWSSRAAQQRGTQERGYRRQRVSRSNLSPLQPLQSDGLIQSGATVLGANSRENESSQSPTDAERQVPATTAQNRNRPW